MLEYLNALAALSLLFITVVSLLGRDQLDLRKTWEVLHPLKNILEFVGNLPKWSDYYNDINANVQLLQDKRERLQMQMEDLRTRVEYEESETSRPRKKEVNIWLSHVETKGVEIQSLLVHTHRESSCFFRFLYRTWLGSHINKKIQEVEGLCHLGVFAEVLSHAREAVELVSGPLVGQATKDNIRKITAWLEDEVTNIGLHGIKGVGKTTFMKHIHNELVKKGDFQVYMIQVPMYSREYDLQRAIAKELDLDLHEEDGIKRAALLHRAMRKRKFVLILDGLTKYFLVENVGIPLHTTRGKIIITSQCPDVCRKMGCQKTIAMDPLPCDEAAELFKQKLDLNSPLEPPLEGLAMEIIKQCQGVALRIVEKAIDLKRVDDIGVWERTLNEMYNQMPENSGSICICGTT